MTKKYYSPTITHIERLTTQLKIMNKPATHQLNNLIRSLKTLLERLPNDRKTWLSSFIKNSSKGILAQAAIAFITFKAIPNTIPKGVRNVLRKTPILKHLFSEHTVKQIRKKWSFSKIIPKFDLNLTLAPVTIDKQLIKFASVGATVATSHLLHKALRKVYTRMLPLNDSKNTTLPKKNNTYENPVSQEIPWHHLANTPTPKEEKAKEKAKEKPRKKANEKAPKPAPIPVLTPTTSPLTWLTADAMPIAYNDVEQTIPLNNQDSSNNNVPPTTPTNYTQRIIGLSSILGLGIIVVLYYFKKFRPVRRNRLTFDELEQHNYNTEQLNKKSTKTTTYYAEIPDGDNLSVTSASSDGDVTNTPVPGE